MAKAAVPSTLDKPAHSSLGASSMHRWSQCPGSVRLSKGIVSHSSSYAEEGTRAHEIAAHRLSTGDWPPGVDAETKENLCVYTNAVLLDVTGGMDVLIEHRFDLSDIHPGMFGTADAVTYSAEKKILRVYDLKYGAGIAVDVESNEQLMYYGLGALLSTKVPCSTVELVIIQPRCEHPDGKVRRWSFPAIDLIDFAADLEAFAKETEKPDAAINPGDHCRFCPAAHKCPALEQRALSVAKEEFSPLLSYDPDKLSYTLTHLPELEAYIKSVREFAYGEASHGRTPPGWKLVAKRATRKWRNENGAIEYVETMGLEDDLIERKIKSPAQAEKVLGKHGFETRMSHLVISESSGMALAPDDDKRPAARLDAASEFELIEKL